jgi:hypothetical protein
MAITFWLASARTGSGFLARAGQGQLADVLSEPPLTITLSDKSSDLQDLRYGP